MTEQQPIFDIIEYIKIVDITQALSTVNPSIMIFINNGAIAKGKGSSPQTRFASCVGESVNQTSIDRLTRIIIIATIIHVEYLD